MKRFFVLITTVFLIGANSGYVFADYAYYVPYFTSQAGESTGLGLKNCDADESAHVTVIVYDKNGTQSLVERATVAARGQTAFIVGQGLNVEGSMRVLSDQPLVILCSVFANGVGYEVPATQALAAKLFVPQAAADNKWGTSVVVNNPNNSGAAVTLIYVSENGQAGTPLNGTIPANGTESYELADLLLGAQASGGSIEITASERVAALVVYDDMSAGGSYYIGFGALDPSDQTENIVLEQYAVVATVAPDFSSGAHSVISVDPPRIAQNNLLPTVSDVTVAANGKYFYRMERTGGQNVTKFDVNDPDEVIWQYSTEGDDVGSNPHDLVFASDTKAYLLRYGGAQAWIVDPSATSEANFKTGELDLSAYDDGDGLPDMHSGVIVDGKLFITMQRFDITWTPQTAYVAVFDTATDQEIDTGMGTGDMLGIPLQIENPGAIQYVEGDGMIYVQGNGLFFGGVTYSSGIETIDPDTYETAMVLDDGDDTSHPYGHITGMSIISPTKGYFVGYAGWGDNTLYSFNPSAPEPVGRAVPGLEHKNISGLESGTYADKNDMLWICNQTDGRVDILDTTDDAVEESISTDLDPSKVVFCEP